MSRSYRKTPIIKDHYGGKTGKQIAAQRLRNIPVESEESEILVNSPSAFKKINHDTYDIHDWITRWTREEAIVDYYMKIDKYEWFFEDYPTLDSYLEYWEKCMHRK